MADEPINVFDTTLFPDLKHVLDRSKVRPNIERVYFPEGALSQGTDLNDAFSIEATRRGDIGGMISSDGDRLSGAEVIVDRVNGMVQITQGSVYLSGAPRQIPAALLSAVPMVGDVKIGARAVIEPVTGADDDIFLGQDPDAVESYGEEGAVRTTIAWSWGHDQDGIPGDFFPYVTIRDGYLISQDAPPTLSGVQQQIAVYDYDSHENYVVRGCQVSALGIETGEQVFSIAEGTANILGFKIQRPFASRYSEPEAPDFGIVDSEPHTFDGSGTATIPVRHGPIAAVSTVIVTKQRTFTISKGTANGLDALPDDSVTAILSVVQGATTYVVNTSYIQNGDNVDWIPGGAEPATGSSYDVTYQYLDAVTPSVVNPSSIVISGGVTGKPVFIGYTYKLPRIDRICLDKEGNVVYLRGLPAPTQPQPPAVPKSVVNLAQVYNDWFGTPRIINDADLAVPVALERKMINKIYDLLNIVTLQKQALDINIRSAGTATGTFSDPLTSDYYRDAGEAQNGAVFNGSFQIPITPNFQLIPMGSPLMLNYTHQIILTQDLVSSCEKINPYMSFSPLPGTLTINPSKDFWTEEKTVWLSPQTRVFGVGNQERVIDTDIIDNTQTAPVRYLRQIPVSYTVKGFGAGEIMTSLTFDGIKVAGPLTANSGGIVTGSFTIPNNVAAGVKQLVATGASGSVCRAAFTGQGRIETLQRQLITTVQRFQVVTPPRLERREGNSGRADPQAQSFSLTEGRHISQLDLRFCQIGNRANPVIVEFVTVENGFPTTEVIAQTEISMANVVVNQWTTFNFPVPFYLPPGQLFAFVIKSNDAVHAISAAERGNFDAIKQRWIAAQPYTIGTRFSSSNAVSWTAHQDSDLTFRLKCATFSPATKIINLGTFAVTDCSDIIVRGDIFLPEDSCKVTFEVDFGTEPTIRIAPDQVYERTSFFTGAVKIRAVLTGNARVSPVVDKDLLAIFGTMQDTGEYISRAFDIGTAVDVTAFMSTKLPVGSSLSVYVDASNDAWTALTQTTATIIDGGFTEREYHKNPYTAALGGRIRLVLTGSPAARPTVADLRAFTV